MTGICLADKSAIVRSSPSDQRFRKRWTDEISASERRSQPPPTNLLSRKPLKTIALTRVHSPIVHSVKSPSPLYIGWPRLVRPSASSILNMDRAPQPNPVFRATVLSKSNKWGARSAKPHGLASFFQTLRAPQRGSKAQNLSTPRSLALFFQNDARSSFFLDDRSDSQSIRHRRRQKFRFKLASFRKTASPDRLRSVKPSPAGHLGSFFQFASRPWVALWLRCAKKHDSQVAARQFSRRAVGPVTPFRTVKQALNPLASKRSERLPIPQPSSPPATTPPSAPTPYPQNPSPIPPPVSPHTQTLPETALYSFAVPAPDPPSSFAPNSQS